MSSNCVLCGENAEVFLEKNGIPIYRCGSCRHGFAQPDTGHVESVYSDDYFFGGKDGYPDYLQEASLLEKRGSKYARRLSKYVEPGVILDVGAAAGFLLKGFVAEGWDGVGLEPNARMVRFGIDELGLDMVEGTLENYQADRRFDAVSLIQVIAHLNDLPRAFDALRSLLKDDGLILVETWNEGSITARALGKYWHEYSPPSVLHWFSRDRLAKTLEGFGFALVAQGRTLKWISARHAMSLASYVFGNRTSSAIQNKIPSSLALPYPSEDLFWGIYKKTG